MKRSSSRGPAGKSRHGIATRAVHAGRSSPALGPAGERSHAPPIFQTANYTYPDAAAAGQAAEGHGFLYSRDANPSSDALAQAVADLENAEAGLAFSSGMAALSTTLLALAEGGEVVASEGLYGGSTEFVRDLGPRHGMSARFTAGWDTREIARAMGPRTRVVLVETISNPLLRIPDLPALADLCRRRGAALVVDNTFASPCLCRPLDLGATVVVHSASKYISGHGDLIGGVVVGKRASMEPVRQHRRLLGGTANPFAAWLALRGLRTLPLRMERAVANARRLADVLARLPGVRRVHYPGRANHPDRARAARLLSGPGAMVSFELRDGAAARRCYDRARVISRAASLGEVSSLFTHPASFSHRALPAAERRRLGISDGLMRLSVGIEDIADLEADLVQAIA